MNEFFIREEGLVGAEITADTEFVGKGVLRSGKLIAVGIICTSKAVYYCIPKYMKISPENEAGKERIRAHLELLAKVIRAMSGKKNVNHIIGGKKVFRPLPNRGEYHISPESVAKAIVNDYISSGIYRYQQTDMSCSGNGRIKWGATVSRTQPLMIGGNVIYPKMYRKSIVSVPDDEIALLHCTILKRCIELLEMGNEVSVSDDLPCIPDSLLDDESRKKHFIRAIEMRMRSSFTDRDLFLLRAMRSWLGMSRYYKEENAYYVTSFELFWQDINDCYWGIPVLKKSGKPRYCMDDGNEYHGSGDQNPDTINIFADGDDICISVFDSKYYVPEIENSQSVLYSPPSTDIAKQSAYVNTMREYLAPMYGEERLKFSNALLLPQVYGSDKALFPAVDGELYRIRGKVRLPAYSGIDRYIREKLNIGGEAKEYLRKETEIKLAAVNPDVLYKRFLAGEKISALELKQNFIDGVGGCGPTA